MRRRTVLAAAAASLMAPALVRAEASRTLRFIPEADLAVLDPVWTTANVTRNHAYMVFDTLYGMDEGFNVQPQMVDGHSIEGDTVWTITLRPGLLFHNGDPVLARDVVASIRRWAVRDGFGQALMAATEDLSAPDDRIVRFRLKQRFPVARALANSVLIMPERLALTDASKQVSEMIGSGPFRFLADERVAGSHVAYAKFDGYVPRPGDRASYTAGPKIVHVDRVEWTVIPDSSTAASAMVAGEIDWWVPPSDLLPVLRKSPRLRVQQDDPSGMIAVMRFNQLYPPFDNPAIRRAVLEVVSQSDFMTAVAGDDQSLWRDDVGVFTPGSPMASEAGMAVLTGKRDFAAAKAAIKAAGYNGEKVVVLNPGDLPDVNALALVGADVLTKAGLNVDLQTMDWGTLIQRRSKDAPPERGGWNVVFTSLNGTGTMDPAGHIGIRGNGRQAWVGWPEAPKLEALRDAWFAAPDVAAQQAICVKLQQQFWQDVPYIPLGERFSLNALNRRVTDVVRGFPLFYGLKLT